ncbi:hypothetical protein [Streptomyces sp. NBC_01187]|uniref:hypothetical protein n=1 Tax=Streptomyces sp. NBC_01187 TaxID=2903766 RepID=UPI00386455C6|nr:hypothetical protein OG220_35880 [Streptomyces sp. NBC_01187]
MTTPDLTPAEGARWALRAGVPLEAGRHEAVAATANHIHGVLAVLRNLDLGETVPAAAYRAVRTEDEDGTKGAGHAAV